MSRNHPLTYPAPVPKKRQSSFLRLIPHVSSRPFSFDSVFSHRIMREHFTDILKHDVTIILIATGISVTGHNYMLVRSAALMVCALWLSVSTGIWVSQRKWAALWKSWFFVFASWFFFVCGMSIMYYFLFSTLEDQQVNNYDKLSSETPAPTNDPFSTMFKVMNGGSIGLDKHQVLCRTNLIVGFGGTSTIESGFNEFGSSFLPEGPLGPGGDARTDPCLTTLRITDPVCLDATVRFIYTLETQPAYLREKDFRFVAKKSGDRFSWYQETLSYPPDYYCGPFDKHRKNPKS